MYSLLVVTCGKLPPIEISFVFVILSFDVVKILFDTMYLYDCGSIEQLRMVHCILY